ncbi:MAG: hypothetical protein AAGJ87_02190, partial [Pseudomonadota bacterium]
MIISPEDWTGASPPSVPEIEGRYVRLAPYEPADHGEPLFAAIGGEAHDALWRFIPLPPPPDAGALTSILTALQGDAPDRWRTAFIQSNDDPAAVGMASFMRMRAGH